MRSFWRLEKVDSLDPLLPPIHNHSLTTLLLPWTSLTGIRYPSSSGNGILRFSLKILIMRSTYWRLNRKLNFASSKVVFLNSCVEIPTKRQHKMSHMIAMFSFSSLFLTYFLFKWLFSLWLFSLASRWLLFTFQLVFVKSLPPTKEFLLIQLFL